MFGSALVALIAIIAGFIKSWNKNENFTKLLPFLVGISIPIFAPLIYEVAKDLSK